MGKKRKRADVQRQAEEKGWKPFAWQGLSCAVPADWDLGSVSGNASSGYVRLDDPLYARLEAKWSGCAGRPPSLEQIHREYVSQLRGKGKRARTVTVTEGPSFRRQGQEGFEECRFRWESDAKGSCLLRYCPSCKRLVFLQVMSRLEEPGSEVAKKVFASLSDHPTDGMVPWAIYDLEFSVPKGFEMESHQLQSGLLDFAFVQGQAALGVKRWSMADAMLRRGTLDLWLKREYSGLLKDVQWRSQPLTGSSHEGLHVEGSLEAKSAKWVMPFLAMLPPWIGERLPLASCASVVVRLWHCPASNRILGIHLKDYEGRGQWVREVADSLACHLRTSEESRDDVAVIGEGDSESGQAGHSEVRSGQESEGGMEEE